MKAFTLLEKEGYIIKKRGIGIFVKSKESLFYNTPSNNLINFASGTPSEDVYPFEVFKNLYNKVLEECGPKIMLYHPTQGLDLILKTLSSKRKNKIVVGNPTYHGALNIFKTNCKIYTVEMENDVTTLASVVQQKADGEPLPENCPYKSYDEWQTDLEKQIKASEASLHRIEREKAELAVYKYYMENATE